MDEKGIGKKYAENNQHIEYAGNSPQEPTEKIKETSTDAKGIINLDQKLTTVIENPLAGLSKEQLLKNVQVFVQEKNLPQEDLPLFERGALAAQNPTDYETIEGLTIEEKTALDDEFDHKWKQPKMLYLSVLLCAIGACVQGWDQTGSNGANLSFPIEFNIDNTDPSNPNYEKYNWLVGMINAAPYFSASVIACPLADPLNHLIGRRGALFVASIFCLLSPIGSATTQNWVQLFICRLLLGLGIGFKEATSVVYAAENAPSAIRGSLCVNWQIWTAFGIMLGNTANLILHKVGKIAWRLQLGSAFIPAVPLILLVYFVPESPRWYIKQNKYEKAYRALGRLRNTKFQAARDLYYIHVQITLEEELAKGANVFTRFTEIFTKPRTRRATLAAFTVMIAQQMCGINIISFFSSSIFSRATDSKTTPLLASFGFGLVNWAFAFPSFFTVDTFGRRSLLLFFFPLMAIFLLGAGLSFLIPEDNPHRLGVIAFFVYMFTACYSPSEGPVPFTYSAEVFDLKHREVGMAFAVFVNNVFAGILSLSFFRIESAMTTCGAFGFYAGLNVLAFIMIMFWVPETKALSLEELDNVFNVKTSKFVRYQFTQSIPWFFKRWVLFNRTATKEPLYHFQSVAAGKFYN